MLLCTNLTPIYVLLTCLTIKLSQAQIVASGEVIESYDEESFVDAQPTVETILVEKSSNDEADDVEDVASIPSQPDENLVFDGSKSADDNIVTKSPSLPNVDETLISPPKTFYSFDAVDIRGETIQLKKYSGMVTLVVNVASECGFTESHYTGLVKLQNMLSPTGKFTVLAFPCNQFGAQEPGDNEEIEQFVAERYRINFPMFAKIRVLDSNIPEAWQYLQETSGKVPNWNFWKYLVAEDGQVVDAWGPWTSVDDIVDKVKVMVDKLTKSNDPILPDTLLHDGSEL